ncbi:type II toxin-antitoxin system mRNA interferase toxin, RelE/StbE family [Candidatus Kaiserbacteria bacterium]|nr:type II toxin-antitoxin system mRNA interferase toxin, RelE/StbE family [Candidatus Kaiserbacteria bacterium]
MKIGLHRRFLKQYTKLPRNIRVQFVERKNLFIQEPFHPLLHNHSVDGVFPGCRSINITGDYRAVFRQQDEQVLFLEIGTHSELYG